MSLRTGLESAASLRLSRSIDSPRFFRSFSVSSVASSPRICPRLSAEALKCFWMS
jgi:hypothetical protein